MNRTSNGDLVFFVNGVSQSIAASGLPERVFAVVDLYGKCATVALMDNTSQVAWKLELAKVADGSLVANSNYQFIFGWWLTSYTIYVPLVWVFMITSSLRPFHLQEARIVSNELSNEATAAARACQNSSINLISSNSALNNITNTNIAAAAAAAAATAPLPASSSPYSGGAATSPSFREEIQSGRNWNF